VNGYNKYTPVRISVPFILGIMFALYSDSALSPGNILQMAFIVYTGLIVAFYLLGTNFGLRWVSGLLANVSLFLLGIGVIGLIIEDKESLHGNADRSLPGEGFICRISDNPVTKSKTIDANAVILARLDSAGRWIRVKAGLLIYFKGDSTIMCPAFGDLVLISGSVDTIPGPSNPGMFDYRQYLSNRQIYYQVFLDQGHWQRIGRTGGNSVMFAANICRERFLETFRRFKIEGREFALVSALMFGTRDYLDSETTQEFSNAGAVHVLSVSGLHVGIMYVVADKVLFFLKRGRRSRKLQQVMIILCIWAYAFITGLPSSVVRAALMFSLLAAGKMFRRSTENFNIVAVAAFFQLLINPLEITQVGFQLSYLAVLGIFAFYKPLNEVINQKNRVVSWTWPILAVSVAAQLATFPLACYYFNMFPVYFLVTNLIVVPLAAVITYFAVFLLVAGGIGITTGWLAWPLILSLRFMSGSVELIQSWPGAVIFPVVLSPWQVLLIYTAIIALFGYIVLSHRIWAFVIPGSFLIISLITAGKQFVRLRSSEMVVYQVNGHTAIDLVHCRHSVFICDSLLIDDSRKIRFHIQPNRINHGIREIKCMVPGENQSLQLSRAWRDEHFIFFRGKKIAVIDDTWPASAADSLLDLDLVVLTAAGRIDPGKLLQQVRAGKIIIDSSVPLFKADRIIKAFQQEGITCHSVRHDGAFVMRW